MNRLIILFIIDLLKNKNWRLFSPDACLGKSLSLFYLYASLSLMLTYSIFSQPTSPENPKEPILQNTENPFENKKKEKANKKTINITLKLCDGRQVSGVTSYEKEEMAFTHIKDGISYEKKLKLSEIRSLRILTWEFKKNKKTKEGQTYQMLPFTVQITATDGETFNLRGFNFPSLMQISLNNQNGIARLYAYWMDLQYDDGHWFSSLSPKKGNEREDCHPDVIRQFQFSPE